MDSRPPRGIYSRVGMFKRHGRVGGHDRRRPPGSPAGRTPEEAERAFAALRAGQRAARARTAESNGGEGSGRGIQGLREFHEGASVLPRNGALGDGFERRRARGPLARTGLVRHLERTRTLKDNGLSEHSPAPKPAPRSGLPALRVGDLYRVWAEAPRSEPLRRTTIKGTRLALARFAAWAGEDRPVTDVTEAMVQAYARERRQHVSAVSVQSELRPLSTALNAAVGAGYLEHRPPIRLARSKRRRPASLKKEEVQVLLEIAPDEGANAELAIRIALGTGLRHQEVLHLRRCDCRLGERPRLIVAAWGDWTPTGGREREVPITRDLADRIAARLGHLPDRSSTAPLFQHPDGRRMGSVARAVAGALRAAGLYRPETRPGLHCLRRTWAMHLRHTGTEATLPALGG